MRGYSHFHKAIGLDLEALPDLTLEVRMQDYRELNEKFDRIGMFEGSWPYFSERLGERFFWMWRYYLLSCDGAFRARDIQLWQWVLSKKGVPDDYRRERIPSPLTH